MPRSLSYQALTIRVKPSGESNREAWFLTAEEGIIKATVFGGPKSRLRARVAPYHEGKLLIYHDPVRDSRKVSDFDVESYRTGIRELYERVMCAAAVAETILAFKGGGSGGDETLKLAGTVLNALETADSAVSSRLGIYFLWHWARLMGEKPDLSSCAVCGKDSGQNEMMWYSNRKEAILCGNCMDSRETDTSFRLDAGAIRWLSMIEALPASEIKRVTLDTSSREQAKTLAKAVLAASLGQRLQSWEGI